MLTNQEIFNKITNHLWQQKEPAYDEAMGQCVYKAKDGNRCAVGCLLDETKVNIISINDAGLSTSRVHDALFLSGVDLTNSNDLKFRTACMLIDFQQLHDKLRNQMIYPERKRELKAVFAQIARTYNMEYNDEQFKIDE